MTEHAHETAPGMEHTGNPVFELAYLVFAYIPFVFMPPNSSLPLLATLLATALFLPLFFGSFRRARHSSPLRVDPGGGGDRLRADSIQWRRQHVRIYAMSMAASMMRSRAAILLGAT